jgi:hypothetical protein
VRRFHLLRFGCVVSLIACSPAQEVSRPPVAAPKSTVATPAPVPVRARWWIDGAPVIRGQLAIGNEILSVGDQGRRTLHVKGADAMPRQADTIVPDDLRDVLRRDDGTFVLIAGKGRTFVTDGPLGPVIETHDAPKGEVHWVAAGKSALVAIVDRDLLRSTDAGKTWTKVAYELDVPSYPSSVAMLSTGAGLLASKPQRVLHTNDDGATWTRIPTPGKGLFRVETQATGILALEGTTGLFHFDPATASFASAKHVFADYPRYKWADSSENVVRAVFGDQVAIAYSSWDESEKPIMMFGVGPIGAPKQAKRLALLDGCTGVGVRGFGDRLVLSCARGGELVSYESDDRGGTFRESLRVPRGEWDLLPAAAVGPEGYLLGAMVCPESGTCTGRVRPAKAKSFQPVTFSEPIQFVHASVVDGPRRRVLAVVRNADKRIRLMQASLDGASFSLVPGIDADGTNVSTSDKVSIATDGAIVRVFLPHLSAHEVVATDGSVRHLDGVGDIAFAGNRGLAISGRFESLESDVAGATWSRVQSPPSAGRPHECAESGCVFPHVERAGWDLPAIPKEGASLAKDGPVPPYAPASFAEPPRPKLPETVPTLTCTAVAGWTKLAAAAAGALDLSPDVRAMNAAVLEGGRAVAVVVHAKKAPEAIELLAAEKLDPKKKRKSVTHAFVDHAGAIAYRYAFEQVEKGAPYGPVDVTVAWLVAGNGKLHRASFKADPFRVATTSGITNTGIGITDSGLWVHADQAGKEAYFVSNEGKVDKRVWPLPTEYSGLSGTAAHASFFDVGKRAVAIRASQSDARLAWLGDDKSWTENAWSLAPFSFDGIHLSRGEGRAWLVVFPYAHAGTPRDGLAFPLESPANDPPAPRVADLRGFGDGTMPACDEKSMSAPSGSVSIDRSMSLMRPVVIEGVQPTTIVVGAMAATVHLAEKGPCVGVLRAAGRWVNAEPFVAIVAPADPGHAWLQRGTVDKNDLWKPLTNVEVRRLECKPSMAKPPAELSPKDAY